MSVRLIVITTFIHLISAADDSVDMEVKTFLQLYEEGVQLYLENNWEDCIYYLEKSLDKYNHYYETVTGCRIECDYEIKNRKNNGDYLFNKNIDDLQFFDMILKKTLCLAKCKHKNLDYLPADFEFEEYYKDIFKYRKPYEYLHLCYLKEGDLEMAGSAAFTFIVQNPNHKTMLDNYNHILSLENVNKAAIRDIEEKKFVQYYLAGVSAYSEENWDDTIKYMESSLYQYILDESQCRAHCEGEFDHGWYPDFVSSIGNHFTNTLYCKQNCSHEVALVRTKYFENLFSTHYEYLQFAYFKLDKKEEAYRAALSYLLFHEKDPTMMENLTFYKNMHYKGKNLTTRSEAQDYLDRRIYEKRMAEYIQVEFGALAKTVNKVDTKHDEL